MSHLFLTEWGEKKQNSDAFSTLWTTQEAKVAELK